MGKRDIPVRDIIFYAVVTAVFMVTSAFGALQGWFGSGITSLDGGPRPSDLGYVALAAFYGSLCGIGCSIPFLLVFLALGLGSVTNRRISTIWVVGNVSACLFAALLMFLTNTLSRLPEDSLLILLVVLAAAPPGLLGLRLITHIARHE
jgi:hypothetical protein